MKRKENIQCLLDALHSILSEESIRIDSNFVSIIKQIEDALNYRSPVSVTDYIRYPKNINGFYEAFDLCPRCGAPLSRTYQKFCSHCGQHLYWVTPLKVKATPFRSKNHSPACNKPTKKKVIKKVFNDYEYYFYNDSMDSINAVEDYEDNIDIVTTSIFE